MRWGCVTPLVALSVLFDSGSFASDEPKPDDRPTTFLGKIVLFGAQREPRISGAVEILTMSPDGTELRSVLRVDQVSFMTGRVSPDRKRLAYGTISLDEKSWETWILDADGARRKVIGDGVVRAWSPDGRSLVCYARRGDGGRCFVVDAETGRSQAVPLPEADKVEDWSPTGDRLSVMAGNPKHVFEHPKKGAYPLRQVYSTDTDGAHRREITSNLDFDNIWSRFSPDGSRIAHYQRRHSDDKVFESFVVRKADGSAPIEVVRNDRLDEELRLVPSYPSYPFYWWPHKAPCFSPDGRSIVACFSNDKWAKRIEQERIALLYVTMEGRIERAVDLKKLGIVFLCELDWR